MRATVFLLAAAPLGVYGLLQSGFEGHAQKLQAAQSLTLTLTTSVIGGKTEDVRVTMSKPNLIKVDDAMRMITTDGKTVWIYDKAGKTYEEKPAGSDFSAEGWTKEGAWVYSAFFNPKFAEDIASATKGTSRKLRNVAVTDWSVTKKDKSMLQVQMDDELGVARGFRMTKDKVEVFVFAKEIKLGDAPLPDAEFAFAPPAGVTKKEAASAGALTFGDIKPILDRSCVGCHGANSPKKGISFNTYENVLKMVTPGDPENSRMMRPVRRGIMPPGGNALPADIIAKLDAWIKGGAKP